MEQANAVLMISNLKELIEKVDMLLEQSKVQYAFADASLMYVQSKSGVVSRYLELLNPYLKPLEKFLKE
jgi:3-deoxy-D-manno-octulosonic-acid transferase